MLEYKRAHGVGMALGAYRELPGSGANLVAGFGAVRIVAIAALNQPDIDAVTIGTGELRLPGSVTSVAQFRLRFHQHEVHVGGLMGAVAGGATDTVCQVLGLG